VDPYRFFQKNVIGGHGFGIYSQPSGSSLLLQMWEMICAFT